MQAPSAGPDPRLTVGNFGPQPVLFAHPMPAGPPVNLDAPLPRVPGFSTRDLQSIDFKPLRTSDLPRGSFMWIFLPVIGWAVLLCRKISYVRHHRAAEAIMKGISPSATAEKHLEVVMQAKKAAGKDLAWQYDLEAARFNLLLDQPMPGYALVLLRNVMKVRGTPSFPGHYTFKDLALVSPNEHSFGIYSEPVLTMTTRSYAEAQLAAAIYSAKGQALQNMDLSANASTSYSDAYDALNETALWAAKQGLGGIDFRNHQNVIARKLFDVGGSSPRIIAILKAERALGEEAEKLRG